MNPFPRINHFKTPAPIPHQSAMKLYESTWIYISKKFWDMRFIDYYGAILTYEKFRYPTIPSFMYLYLLCFHRFCKLHTTPLWLVIHIIPYKTRFFNSQLVKIPLCSMKTAQGVKCRKITCGWTESGGGSPSGPRPRERDKGGWLPSWPR